MYISMVIGNGMVWTDGIFSIRQSVYSVRYTTLLCNGLESVRQRRDREGGREVCSSRGGVVWNISLEY